MRRRPGLARSSRRHAGHMLSVPALAGWLFADLFLVLFIVAFSSQPTVALPKPKPAASHTHMPPQHKKHGPQGLQSAPVDFKLYVSPTDLDSADPAVQDRARTQLLAGVHQQLASRDLLGRKAGFVLIFATSVNSAGDPINEALKVATSVIQNLKRADPKIFPAGTGGEGLWAGTGDYFHFQIFFHTR